MKASFLPPVYTLSVWFSFFFLYFLFCIVIYQLTNNGVLVSGEHEGTQPYMYFCSVSSFVAFLFQIPHIRAVAQHFSFSAFTRRERAHGSRQAVRVAADGIIPVFSWLSSALHARATSSSIPLLMDFQVLRRLGRCQQCCSEHRGCVYPFGACFSPDICAGGGLQGHVVVLF